MTPKSATDKGPALPAASLRQRHRHRRTGQRHRAAHPHGEVIPEAVPLEETIPPTSDRDRDAFLAPSWTIRLSRMRRFGGRQPSIGNVMDDSRIERLHASHDRKAFDCGQLSLDEVLRALVGQYEKGELGRTYVGRRRRTITGFRLSHVLRGLGPAHHLSAKAARKLPKHPVPWRSLGG